MGLRHVLSAVAIAAVVLAPRPASAALPYDPHVVMYTWVSSGLEYFTSTYNDGGMPPVVRSVQGCYAYNDHPGWTGRFVICNAEDDAGYLYSRDTLQPRGIAPLPYFTRAAFDQRQNTVLATFGVPPSKRKLWIESMLRRVAGQLKFSAQTIGPQP